MNIGRAFLGQSPVSRILWEIRSATDSFHSKGMLILQTNEEPYQ